MNKIFELAKEENSEVRVYDTSRVTERLKAWKRGILRTPAVVIEDVKYQGLDEIVQATKIRLKH